MYTRGNFRRELAADALFIWVNAFRAVYAPRVFAPFSSCPRRLSFSFAQGLLSPRLKAQLCNSRAKNLARDEDKSGRSSFARE